MTRSRSLSGLATLFVGFLLAACGHSSVAPPTPTPAPDPNTQVIPTKASGPVQIVFAGASVPPGSTVSGCGVLIEGCKGKLVLVFELHPPSTGHALHARVYLHSTNLIACLGGQTSSFDLQGGVPARVEVSLDDADRCGTPVMLVAMDAIVEGPAEVASRQEWTLHYLFAP